MEDLEQQCEDAVLELCDARERYPLRCSNELKKCIKLQNDINIMKVLQKPKAMDKFVIVEQGTSFKTDFSEKDIHFGYLDYKLHSIINKVDNLKAVMEQIEREKTCETNKLLKD